MKNTGTACPSDQRPPQLQKLLPEARCVPDDMCWKAAGPRQSSLPAPGGHSRAGVSLALRVSRAHLVVCQPRRKSHDEPIYRAYRALWHEGPGCSVIHVHLPVRVCSSFVFSPSTGKCICHYSFHNVVVCFHLLQLSAPISVQLEQGWRSWKWVASHLGLWVGRSRHELSQLNASRHWGFPLGMRTRSIFTASCNIAGQGPELFRAHLSPKAQKYLWGLLGAGCRRFWW